MEDFVDRLLRAQIESQLKEKIKPDFEKGTKLKIFNTGDEHLKPYIGTIGVSTGIQQNYSSNVKKTKVKLKDGSTAYFKNSYLIRL